MEGRIITNAHLEQFRRALCCRERSTVTVRKYLRDVERFRRFAGEEEVTKEQVIAYKQMLQKNYAPASLNSMLAALNCFFKELGWQECRVGVVKLQRGTFRSRERELTKGEYLRLLNTAKSQGKWRLYQIMQTLCATGIRVSELRFITVEAVDRGFAEVSLKGKTRQILLPTQLCRELKAYAKKAGICRGCLFITRSGGPVDRSNVLHAMKSLCAAAGVDRRKVFPHNLRHLFACQFYRATRDLSRLADLLGHSSIDTTRIYTQISYTEQLRQIDRLDLVIKSTA